MRSFIRFSSLILSFTSPLPSVYSKIGEKEVLKKKEEEGEKEKETKKRVRRARGIFLKEEWLTLHTEEDEN